MSFNTDVMDFELDHHIAQGCLTNSKHPDRFVKGVYPKIIQAGRGGKVVDLKGYEYTDFISGLGTNLYGYGNPRIKGRSTAGMPADSPSLPSKWEIIAARQVKTMLPWVDRVKFVNDGSSACTAACIIARAWHQARDRFTDKADIISDGYHGWHPEFTYLTPPSFGVVRHQYITAASITAHACLDNVASIIIEPVMLDDSKERIEYLKEMRNICTKHDIILIFDETISAFRFPKLTFSRYASIEPDLIIFGKALGNGEKISCVAGKKEIMDGEYFVSGTYHGHVPSLIAAATVIDLAKCNQAYDISYLKEKGLDFQDNFNEIWDGEIRLDGYGTRGAFRGDPTVLALWMQEMCKSGFLFGPSFFPNWANALDFDDVLYATKEVARRIRNNEVLLAGPLPTSPFSSKAREEKNENK